MKQMVNFFVIRCIEELFYREIAISYNKKNEPKLISQG